MPRSTVRATSQVASRKSPPQLLLSERLVKVMGSLVPSAIKAPEFTSLPT